ncbi:MAG: hypothetical protein GWN01_12840 [Nitrosopumilaceae archaeon]|nr:hypothetical protein [Nitrosopumilaceae archaeon]NIU86082.1 hypothetical protein [Nitrosopumilaceae archaeon]NIX62352.1 hypothetical protein [Nitrosopumilaceae archaeon]
MDHRIIRIIFVLIGFDWLIGCEQHNPPYPVNPVISDVCWSLSFQVICKATGSDNWSDVWANNVNLYIASGDSCDFPRKPFKKSNLDFTRIEGTSDNSKDFNVWGGFES